ncbi:fatty acyl-AMP ligase [Kitasatospora sp. NPDC058965]|uniref:fatty acyl-AMP ligase n=1 Tax=Kitasatospora sp. NPDC058965 TaxID=3346682 RepID=UPI0036A5E177
MPQGQSLAAVLADRFAAAPGDTALVFAPDARPQAAEQRLSYAELDRRARGLAHWLVERGAQGQPVLIPLDSGVEFAVAVVGCLFAGAVAVPVPPPGTSRAATERTAAIVKECARTVVLTDRAHAAELSRLLADADRGSLLCRAVETLPGAAPDDWSPPELDPQDPALIQYTSGTTAAPRGVLVSHANLLATMTAIQQALGTHRGSRIGGWLPGYHDLGLIGQLLHPLWLGATAVLLPVHSFLVEPARWLHAIDRYGITVAAAPDSAYARCATEVTPDQLTGLDLSRWEVAVNAAEPVAAVTLERFAERFAPAGLRPRALVTGYGLAEASLLVAVSAPGAAPVFAADPSALGRGRLRPAAPGGPARRLVGSGRPHGVELRIVDPGSRAELADGETGEIWVRGPAVTAGYHQRPLETAESFRACTAGGARGFLRTGDLGVLQDGELYVTGRLKDLLKVAGRGLHPQEVERQLAACGTQFGSAAVFAPGPDERVVAVQEVRFGGRGGTDLPGIAQRVRGCLAEEFGGAVGGVLLVRPGTVRRTTSGKVQRSMMRELFLRGELRPLHAELDPDLTPGRTAGSPRWQSQTPAPRPGQAPDVAFHT